MAGCQAQRSSKQLRSFLRSFASPYHRSFDSPASRILCWGLENSSGAEFSFLTGRLSRYFSGRTYVVDLRRDLWPREHLRNSVRSDELNSAQRLIVLPSLRRNITTSRPRKATGAAKGDPTSITKPQGPPASARYIRGSPVSWASLGLLVITGVGLLFYFELEKRRRIEAIKSPPEAKVGPSVGKAAIGGPFKLINHEGKVVTDRDLKGNWTLIYFGFTHCPDICPDELVKMAEAIDKIEKKTGIQVVPVFISVDPERDTVQQLREYLHEFHPRLIGLTGSVDDVRKAAKEYRVYYMKTEDDGNDYLVDHSIIMYLMDPNMDFVKFYGKNYDAESLASGVAEEIKNYKPPAAQSSEAEAKDKTSIQTRGSQSTGYAKPQTQ